MRTGKNTSKEQIINVDASQHRVILPLYIPHENDYYKESYSIFELCVGSLKKTAHSFIKISVVSNGSCDAVNEKLMQLYNEKVINELIIERDPIGKLNSILKVLRTCDESYITVSDADILFKNNWEKEIMNVFEDFPKAAAVSPIPVFRTQNHYTSNILFDYFLSKKIEFTKVKDPDALTLFAKSIGWSRLDEKWKDVIMTITSKKKTKAIVGCNHCVVTYKRDVFEVIPKESSKYKLGGDSEGEYLDKPPLHFDGYRLSTENNYAYHMGNTSESWMHDEFNNLKTSNNLEKLPEYKKLRKRPFRHFIKNKIFKKLISSPRLRKPFYLRKGLSKDQLKNFF